MIDGLGDDGEVDFVWAGTWQETYGATLKAKTAGGKAAGASCLLQLPMLLLHI